MTTAAASTTTSATVKQVRGRKDGLWSSLTSVSKSLANVIGDVAQTGSVATSGLMIQAEAYRLEAVEDLMERYGSHEALEEAQNTANAVIARIRAS